jgi:hypothetical protein
MSKVYDSLQDFQCALSVDKHFIIEPINLINCGHSVCKTCLPKGNITEIKCKKCGFITYHDLNNVPVSKDLQKALKLFLSNIFAALEQDTTIKLNKLKSI